MKKKILLLLAALAFIGAAAQTPEADLRAMPDRAGANYHSYEFGNHPLTPAPEGFKPFYISHYGRHGSRNLTHDAFKYPVSKLKAMKKKKLLNERGKNLLEEAEKLYKISDDQWGRLTPRGKQEQARLAEEMMDRFPEIFAGSPAIRARSSYSNRCLRSMDSFTEAIAARNPDARIDKDGGKQYRYYINDLGKEVAAPSNDLTDSLKIAWLDPVAFLRPFVTDPEEALTVMSKPHKFEWEVGEICLITQCMDTDRNLAGEMPEAELLKFWRIKNIQLWYKHGRSPEYGALRVPLARNLAVDFVHKADSAIVEGTRADLRFGHDSALLPLMCYLGFAGFDREISWEQADTWHSYSEICMGSNLQLVFYRDPAGRILVQCIYNSRETSIPALGPGPFYPWPQLRAYILSLEK